jgi:hypothetical protein
MARGDAIHLLSEYVNEATLRLNCFGKGSTNAEVLYVIHAESIAEEV